MPSESNDDVARFGLERDGTLYFERDGELVETTGGYEVLHYTGLDDSEGTPIYEGDILEYWTENKGIVSWNEYHMAFELGGVHFDAAPPAMRHGRIRTCYEDPELLESVTEAP